MYAKYKERRFSCALSADNSMKKKHDQSSFRQDMTIIRESYLFIWRQTIIHDVQLDLVRLSSGNHADRLKKLRTVWNVIKQLFIKRKSDEKVYCFINCNIFWEMPIFQVELHPKRIVEEELYWCGLYSS